MRIATAHIAALLPGRNFLRRGSIVVLGNTAAALAGVVAIRIYTDLAPSHLFGAANLVLGILALAFQLFVQPVSATQLRYHTEANKDARGDAFTGEAMLWSLAGSAVAVAFCLTVLLVGGGGASTYVLVGAALWIVLSAARNVFICRLHAEQRMGGYVAIRVAEAVLFVVATSALLVVAPSVEAFIWGQAGAFLAILIGVIALAPWPVAGLLRFTVPELRTPSFWTRLRRYGAPFVPMAVLQWLANMGDRYVLASLLGVAAAGQYLAPFAIASRGFIMATGVMTDLFRPALFDAETHGDHARARRIFRAWLCAYLAIGLAGIAAIALLGKWIAWLLLAESYRDGAVSVMVWIGLGYTVSGMTTALESRMLSLGRSAKIVLPLGLGAVANVLFALLLVPRTGIVGAAQANFLSFAVQFVMTAIVLERTLRRRKKNG